MVREQQEQGCGPGCRQWEPSPKLTAPAEAGRTEQTAAKAKRPADEAAAGQVPG